MDIREEKINKINEILGINLASSISFIANAQEEKDKLIYTTFLHYHEKLNHSKAELKKCQEEMLECPPEIAPYVTSIIYSFDTPHVDDRLPLICSNFLTYELESLAEEFVDDYNTIEEIEDDNFLNFEFYFLDEEFSHFDFFVVVMHFFQLGYRTAKLQGLIEDGENTIKEESQKNTPQNNTNQVIIADNNFEKFKTDLEYNYPFEHAPMVYFQKWKTNLSHFKKEVLNNITNLSTERRIPFLNKLLFELEEMLDGIQVTKEELDELYLQHNTSENDIFKKRDFKNSLHIAIHSEPAEFENHFKGGFDPMSETYQFTFYNYHYGQTINNAIIFLKEQKIEYTSNSIEIEKKVNESKEANNKFKSFEYIYLQTESENITNLLKELKRLNLVDQVTELKHFRTVFTNKEVVQKINWTGNISELAFFIKTIHNTSKKVKDTKQKLWEITVNCFQMDNGSILEQSKLRGQKKPATSSEIEKVINDYL
jgi:hypothetical protein